MRAALCSRFHGQRGRRESEKKQSRQLRLRVQLQGSAEAARLPRLTMVLQKLPVGGHPASSKRAKQRQALRRARAHSCKPRF